MGYSRWDDDSWSTYSSTTSAKPAATIFKSRDIHPDLDPMGVVMRESRDSALNPESTPIIVGVDETGSMGSLADYIIKSGLGVLFKNILDKKPVTDPHLMVVGLGDANCDRAPLQVSQFEADISITDQVEKIFIEGNGGGNGYETYEMAWYFAAYHTSTDCFEKRGKKGYLFTVGDEPPSPGVMKSHVKKFIGDDIQANISLEDMLEIVSKQYHVYHIIVAEGSHCRYHGDEVKKGWRDLMGERAVWLTDHNSLSEVIVSLIQVNEGEKVEDVVSSWSGTTALAVKTAVSNQVVTTSSDSSAIVRF